eukprot:116709-Prymnesium_polylepis.1
MLHLGCDSELTPVAGRSSDGHSCACLRAHPTPWQLKARFGPVFQSGDGGLTDVDAMYQAEIRQRDM